jgi:hypothetical protein
VVSLGEQPALNFLRPVAAAAGGRPRQDTETA